MFLNRGMLGNIQAYEPNPSVLLKGTTIPPSDKKQNRINEVAGEAKPPVCRIMDFGKFNYDKKKRQTKNKSHQTKLKEIRVRPKTGQHDIDFKVKKAIGFLEHLDKVQVTVLFRGRENAHIDEGRKVMDGIIEQLSEYGKVESRPSQQQRRMICTIAPLKTS